MEGAIREYKLALYIDPKYANAHSNLLAALAEAKRIQESLAALDTAKQSVDAKDWPPIRYNAACTSALAGCGHGDAATLPNERRSQLRKQALGWPAQELTDLAKLGQNGDAEARKEVARKLRHIVKADGFNGVREAKSLETLDPAERQEWEAYWKDLTELLERMENEKSKPSAKEPEVLST